MRARLTGVIAVFVAVGAAACGGSSGGGGAGATKTGGSTALPSATISTTAPPVVSGSGACALVTPQEASTVVGSTVPAASEKSFSVPLGGTTIKEQVCLFGSEVLVARIDLGGAASTLFSQYRASLESDSDFQQVSGVGDEAFFAKGQLAVRQGETGLIVDVGQNLGDTSNEQEKEKALAAIALGRL